MMAQTSVDIIKDSIPNSTRGHTGSKSIGVTALQISSHSNSLETGMTIRAAGNNAGIIYIGFREAITAGTADTTDGFPLNANDALKIPIEFINQIWIIASEAGQKIFWIAQ